MAKNNQVEGGEVINKPLGDAQLDNKDATSGKP